MKYLITDIAVEQMFEIGDYAIEYSYGGCPACSNWSLTTEFKVETKQRKFHKLNKTWCIEEKAIERLSRTSEFTIEKMFNHLTKKEDFVVRSNQNIALSSVAFETLRRLFQEESKLYSTDKINEYQNKYLNAVRYTPKYPESNIETLVDLMIENAKLRLHDFIERL